MRSKLVFLAATTATFLGATVAVAGHVTQTDPAAVPTGFLVAHNSMRDIPFAARASILRVALPGNMDAFVQHVHLGANVSTGWHTHPGPALVTIVKGGLVYEAAEGRGCRQRTYVVGPDGVGHGFVDPGFGNVHRAIAGPEGVDFYVTYLLPPGSPNHVITASTPAECAS
jgi:hypothetical protein